MSNEDRHIIDILSSNDLFKDLDRTVLTDIAASMSEVTLDAGDYLIRQGELGDSLYLVAHGRLTVEYENEEGQVRKLGELGVGDIVGEIALLTHLRRTASVRAIRQCALLKMPRKQFEIFVKNQPNAAMGIVSACVSRLLPGYKPKNRTIKSVALVPCQQAVTQGDYLHRIISSLKESSSVAVIDKQPDDLYRIENDHDMVIWVADDTLTDWTMECVTHADKIIFVTSPNGEPHESLKSIANENPRILSDKYLLIVHPGGTTQPSGSEYILKHFTVTQHFHLAINRDYQRFIRFILGQSIALVLSGGGIRGIAHLGTFRALHERDIPIDLVAGTSFGALATIACGLAYSPRHMEEIWARVARRIKKVVDLTLPYAAIAQGRVLNELLEEAYPESIHMEDLWKPAFCVATDIKHSAAVKIDTGPAWKAVRASLSIPGIFPPVVTGKEILVDGASMNNLPVDLMSQINNGGKIIASVASGVPISRDYKGYDGAISGSRLFIQSMLGKERITPRITETMLGASLCASQRHQTQMQMAADLCIQLNVSNYALLDVDKWHRIYMQGYRHACELLDSLDSVDSF